jgi:hypothetical protein
MGRSIPEYRVISPSLILVSDVMPPALRSLTKGYLPYVKLRKSHRIEGRKESIQSGQESDVRQL